MHVLWRCHKSTHKNTPWCASNSACSHGGATVATLNDIRSLVRVRFRFPYSYIAIAMAESPSWANRRPSRDPFQNRKWPVIKRPLFFGVLRFADDITFCRRYISVLSISLREQYLFSFMYTLFSCFVYWIAVCMTKRNSCHLWPLEPFRFCS